jgi:hypothetical protein
MVEISGVRFNDFIMRGDNAVLAENQLETMVFYHKEAQQLSQEGLTSSDKVLEMIKNPEQSKLLTETQEEVNKIREKIEQEPDNEEYKISLKRVENKFLNVIQSIAINDPVMMKELSQAAIEANRIGKDYKEKINKCKNEFIKYAFLALGKTEEESQKLSLKGQKLLIEYICNEEENYPLDDFLPSIRLILKSPEKTSETVKQEIQT